MGECQVGCRKLHDMMSRMYIIVTLTWFRGRWLLWFRAWPLVAFLFVWWCLFFRELFFRLRWFLRRVNKANQQQLDPANSNAVIWNVSVISKSTQFPFDLPFSQLLSAISNYFPFSLRVPNSRFELYLTLTDKNINCNWNHKIPSKLYSHFFFFGFFSIKYFDKARLISKAWNQRFEKKKRQKISGITENKVI